MIQCMNPDALLLISEEKNLHDGKIYCLLPLVLKLEGLHGGIKQYFIFHTFCRILQLRQITPRATTPTLYSKQSFLQGRHKPCFQTHVRGLVLKAFSPRTLPERLLFFIFSVQGAHYDSEKSQ